MTDGVAGGQWWGTFYKAWDHLTLADPCQFSEVCVWNRLDREVHLRNEMTYL